jgi:hypothetical protein
MPTDAAWRKKEGTVITVMTTPIPEPSLGWLFLGAVMSLGTLHRFPRWI